MKNYTESGDGVNKLVKEELMDEVESSSMFNGKVDGALWYKK